MATFVGRLGALGTANRIAGEINEQATETNPNPEITELGRANEIIVLKGFVTVAM